MLLLRTAPDSHTPSVAAAVPEAHALLQIRLHLAYLGHGIPNDPLYGPSASIKPAPPPATVGTTGVVEPEPLRTADHTAAAAAEHAVMRGANGSDEMSTAVDSGNGKAGLAVPGWFDSSCPHCEAARAAGVSGPNAFFVPPKRCNDDWQCTEIWLHAFAYESADWRFCSELPDWACDVDTAEIEKNVDELKIAWKDDSWSKGETQPTDGCAAD
jgi:hypothetical protein